MQIMEVMSYYAKVRNRTFAEMDFSRYFYMGISLLTRCLLQLVNEGLFLGNFCFPDKLASVK